VEEFNVSTAFGYEKNQSSVELYASSFNTKIGILRAAHTGNITDLDQSIRNERPWYVADFSYDINNPYQKINHHLLKIKARTKIKGLGEVGLLYGGQYNARKEYDIRRGGRSSRPALLMNLFSHVVDLSLDHEKNNHQGSIGINGTFKQNSNDTEETGIRPLIPNYTHAGAGIFIFEKHSFGKVTLEAGGRYDFQRLEIPQFVNNDSLIRPIFHFNYFSGTIGVTYLHSSTLRVSSNLGVSTRPPHVSELYSEGLHHGTASIEEGLMRTDTAVLADQKYVRNEFSTKWISSLQYTSKKITLDFSVHANWIDNYVFLEPYGTRNTIRGYFPVFRYSQTDALLSGTDWLLQWQVTKAFSVQHKGSYLYAADIYTDDVLTFIPPVQAEWSVTYSKDNAGKYQDFFVTLSAPVAFKQTRAPAVVYPGEIENYSGSRTIDFMPAPDGYVLLNVEAGVKIPIQKRFLFVSLTADNLLNTRYRNYMNRLRYFADDVGRNVVVRLSYKFFND
jgi:iron complex outermembrane receptor protein